MDSHFIWGSSGFASLLRELIEEQGGQVVAVIDNDQEAVSIDPQIPIYIGLDGFRNFLNFQRADSDRSTGLNLNKGVVAIGRAGEDRHTILTMLRNLGFETPTIRAPNSNVAATARIGVGCYILANSVIASRARIGDDCLINHSTTVDHECRLGNGVHVAPGATLCGIVSIGDNAFVGANATILPRIQIGARSVVGAGSVVTCDVSPDSVVIGNPARPMS